MKPDDKSPCPHQRRSTVDGNQSVHVSLVKADIFFFSHQSIVFIQDTAMEPPSNPQANGKAKSNSSDSGHVHR